ncbi:hypothetical protein BrevBR_08290 [Brevundimonas sp. BR2-1]|uniref:hypothetical protein n=1 Tax=Brevundimonas sp. BR2-1 TaxID=3031123 RepID=UPI00309A1E49
MRSPTALDPGAWLLASWTPSVQGDAAAIVAQARVERSRFHTDRSGPEPTAFHPSATVGF